MFQSSQDTYNKLDGKLFEAYIEVKSNPIVGTMETNMYRGKFDWRTCREPTGKLLNITKTCTCLCNFFLFLYSKLIVGSVRRPVIDQILM